MALYNQSYYIGGAESNYVDYTKKDYTRLARDIKKILKLKKDDIVLDYGCAIGTLVKELNKYCHCWGTDISDWAIRYGFKNLNLIGKIWKYNDSILMYSYDYVIALDVLEHMNDIQINKFFTELGEIKNLKKIIVRVPVCKKLNNKYVLDCSNKDKTHLQIKTKAQWGQLFMKYGFDNFEYIDEKRIYDSEGVLAWVISK